MRHTIVPHPARQIWLVLTIVVLTTAGCGSLNITNNKNTNNGSCNAAGGNNSVECSSAPTASASATAGTPAASSTQSTATGHPTGEIGDENCNSGNSSVACPPRPTVPTRTTTGTSSRSGAARSSLNAAVRASGIFSPKTVAVPAQTAALISGGGQATEIHVSRGQAISLSAKGKVIYGYETLNCPGNPKTDPAGERTSSETGQPCGTKIAHDDPNMPSPESPVGSLLWRIG
jgi:hypothetical protein